MVKKKRSVAIVQARMSSSRLPGKAMFDLCGKTVLERVLQRTKSSQILDDVWLATSSAAYDDVIEIMGKGNNVGVFRGSLNDVLDRYHRVAEKSKADIIVRVTADNPLTETRFIDTGVNELINDELDYLCFKNMPYGSGIEVITNEALAYSRDHATQLGDREHVTMFVKNRPEQFKIKYIEPSVDSLKRPDIRVTIDTIHDYVILYKAFSYYLSLGTGAVSLENVIEFLDRIKS